MSVIKAEGCQAEHGWRPGLSCALPHAQSREDRSDSGSTQQRSNIAKSPSGNFEHSGYLGK